MNIFCVDADPIKSAIALVDRHVVKMILESTHLLLLSHNVFGGPTKPETFWKFSLAWKNHPCAKWVMNSLSNYKWLAQHNIALCDEYTYRYKRIHKVRLTGIDLWLTEHNPNLKDIGLTTFTEATGHIHLENHILTYRKYYLECKQHLMVWTKREPPQWIASNLKLIKNGNKWKIDQQQA